MNDFGEKHQDKLYFVFRILVGLFFFMHGSQKLFGWFGGSGGQKFLSLMWFTGIIEIVVGVVVFLGFLTRWGALLGAITMLVAYFKVHAPAGFLNPLANKGELALMYFVAFLVLMAFGSGK